MGVTDHFTIIVDAIDKDSDVSFGRLVLRHGECSGGAIDQTGDAWDRWWRLKCVRCSCNVQFEPGIETSTAVVLTAIDGKERQFRAGSHPCSVIRSDG